MFSNRSCFAPLTVAFAGFLCHSIAVAQDPQSAATAEPQARMPVSLQTTDYLVPHISTVPAYAGKRVELFVREKVASRRRGSAPRRPDDPRCHQPGSSCVRYSIRKL